MSHKLCFCKDLTQFNRIEYPDLPLARSFGLTGCFAICLQGTCAKNYDYILEFFLNPKNTYGEYPSTFLCSILETMKQYFPSCKLASGEELGKELSIEFIKPRLNQKPASFQCQTTSSPSNRPGVLQNGQEMMQPHSSNQQLIVEVDDINNDWDVVDADQNNILVSCSDEEPATFQCQSTRSPLGSGALHNGQEQNNVPVARSDEEARMNQEPDSSQCQSTISPPGFEVSHNWQETTPPNQPVTEEVEVDDVNNGRTVIAEQNNTDGSSSEDANSITYEELEKHFGKKIEDVAKIFRVSRSTFKRICREKKISRWPQGRGKKFKGFSSRRNPTCSELPAKKLVATDAYMTPLVRPPPEVRMMTIKATYGDDMIKFQLPFSSRMVELEEEVSESLKLNVGTYKIKYLDDDGDRILITRDKDLQYCMSASNSLGMDTIKMFIEPITKISPST
ncbi:protein NLP3-like [Cornus florida]|uniref:protein NLP3-like n=1 Tax=Cornus florida TaxID=4283 RepID=UPI002899135D|nr:protein NLP3-like [Cornus florida]